jgi:hypothetical protein
MEAPPLVDGVQPLADGLVIRLPFAMARRVDDGSLVFWHTPKGLTFWIDVQQRNAAADPVAGWRRRRGAGAYDEIVEHDGDIVRLGYRLAEAEGDGREPAFYGLVAAGTTQLMLAAYFNTPGMIADVLRTWRSIRKAG